MQLYVSFYIAYQTLVGGKLVLLFHCFLFSFQPASLNTKNLFQYLEQVILIAVTYHKQYQSHDDIQAYSPP